MSLPTAPYDGSMKIGHGFNSYTQSICLRNAVKLPAGTKITKAPLAVDHSTHFVDDFSDVIRALGISPAAYIRSSSRRDTHTINIDKFVAADINILVHVKVTTATETLTDDVELNLVEGVNEANFAEVYGDTFISGFRRGGNFVGLISLKVHDQSKVTEVRTQLETSVGMARTSEYKSFSDANLAELAEATVFVSWTGGPEQKPSSSTWDVESVFRAAATFAGSCSYANESISAILTKYTSLPSFLRSRCQFKTASYDTAEGYTFDLLADSVTYSTYLHRIEAMRRRGALKYTQSEDSDAYPVTPTGLNSARRDVRKQLLAIVAEVDTISRDPAVALDTTRDVYTDPYVFSSRLPMPSIPEGGFDVPASSVSGTKKATTYRPASTEPDAWKWIQVSGFKSNSPVLFTHGTGSESADSMMLKIYEWESKNPDEYIAGFDLRNGKVYKKVDPYQLAKASGDGLYIRVLLDDKWKFVGQRYIKTENSNSQNRPGVGRDIVADLVKLAEGDAVGAFDYNGSWVTSLREEAITTKGSGLACRGIWIRKEVYEALKFEW